MQMSFLDFLQSSTDVLKSSIILNHSLHSLPLHLMLMHKAFLKDSRWMYWIWSVTSRSTRIWVFLISTILFRKKVTKISFCNLRNSLWRCLAVRTFVNSSSRQWRSTNPLCDRDSLVGLNVWMQHCNWLTPEISILMWTPWFLPNQRQELVGDGKKSEVLNYSVYLSLIHIWRCRRIERCRSRWSPYH